MHRALEHIAPGWSKRLFAIAFASLVLAGSAAAQVPNAPSDVKLTVVREDAINVSWTDNSNNETAFDIFRAAGIGNFMLLTGVDRNITTFSDHNSGIRANVRYCYAVAARNGFGSSPRSDSTCVTVPPRPTAPTDLQVSREDQSSPITLKWTDNASNETNFLVYRDTDGTAFVLYDTVSANITTFDDTFLRVESNYCYFVTAINRAGESSETNIACLDVVNTPVPPVDLAAETISDSSIRVTWAFTDLINFATLFVERSSDDQATWTDVSQTRQIIEEFTDTGLSANTRFCYRVRLEAESNSTGTSTVDCTTTGFSVPDAPEGVAAVSQENRSIGISWEPVLSDQVLYRVERQSGGSAFVVAADSLSETSFTDSDLDASLVHCYRIQAFNPEFESEVSETVCGIVLPDPLVSVSAIPHPDDPMRSAQVTWQPGADVPGTGFLVFYRVVGDDVFMGPITVSANETAISGLDDDTSYEVAVQAELSIGDLATYSPMITTTVRTYLSFWPGDVNGDGQVTAEDVVALTAPSCFGGVTGFSTSGRDVAWAEIAVNVGDEDPSLLRCDADRSGSVDIFDFLAIAANAGRTTGKGTGVATGTITDDAHLARVKAILTSFIPTKGNPAQERLKADLQRIVETYAGELPDEVALSEAYPNPTSGGFSTALELPESSRVSTYLFNAAGQLVRRSVEGMVPAGMRILKFDATDYAPGQYFVVVEAGGKRLTKSITVLR